MAALYTAVPAVTGQLVLGAKAGSASLVKDAFSGAANDGGQAAKTGAQHAAVNALQTNKGSLGQMAYAKAMRKGTGADGQGPSLAMQGVEAGNRGLRENMAAAKTNLASGDADARAKVADKSLGSLERGGALLNAGGGGSGAGGASNFGLASAKLAYGRRSDMMGVAAGAQGRMAAYEEKGRSMVASGLDKMGDRIGQGAEFEAQSAAWEAKNEFASHASAMGGIAGMNAGTLSAGEKPQDARGMGMYGMLDGYNSQGQADPARSHSDALSYAGEGFVHEANGLFSTPQAPLITRDGQMGFPTKAGVTLGGGGAGAAASNSTWGTWKEAGGSLTAAGALEKMVAEGSNLDANTGYGNAVEWGGAAKNYVQDYWKNGEITQPVGPVSRVGSSGTIQQTDAIPSPPKVPEGVPGANTVNEFGQRFTDAVNGKK